MLFVLMRWDYVSELRPPKGLLFIPQVMSRMSHGGTILAEETEELGEKPVVVSLCPP
jgi:hypothetical protein